MSGAVRLIIVRLTILINFYMFFCYTYYYILFSESFQRELEKNLANIAEICNAYQPTPHLVLIFAKK